MELALAMGRGPVSASLIAKRQNLSVAYLEQLLHRLKKRGIVSSIRGPRGGYVLAKDPEQITAADIVLLLDGDGELGNGTGQESGRKSLPNGRNRLHHARVGSREANRHAHRVAEAVWRCVHERLTASLSTVTLQDLCQEVRTDAGEPLDHRYVFHI